MTDLTLEELRGMFHEQELAAKLRQDAFLVRGPYTDLPRADGRVKLGTNGASQLRQVAF